MKSKRKRITKEALIKSLIISDGIVMDAEKVLNVSHSHIYTLINKWDLKPMIEELRNRITDHALSTVKSNLDSADVALKYLNYIARKESTKFNLNIEKAKGVEIVVGSNEDKEEVSKFINN